MRTFLSYVAQDLLEKFGEDLSDIAIVFPNKRASLFLNEELARQVEKPIWSPNYITISDLFRQHCDLKVGDPIKLVCELHKCFIGCTGINETLDHFYGWGQLLVTDFDDIDKNLADADRLFANLKDIHELDDISYLTEDQKKMLQKFFSNFSDEHNSELKKRFLQLWSHFADIYHTFNEKLASQGLAYEGALYRKVVDNNELTFRYKKYIFVGFNMMQRVELKLCDRLQKEGKALFYWDYDNYYMGERNEASHYIRQYLQHYPNELADGKLEEIYDNMRSHKDITYVSAPTENIQARYVNSWLMTNNRYKEGKRTAIVLADETLLQPVIHSIPQEASIVNVTIGYPLQQTPFFSLLQQLIRLQTIGRSNHANGNSYRLHYVLTTLRHPYMRFITHNYNLLLTDLNEHKRFYPTRQSLIPDNDEGAALLFKNIDDTSNFNLSLVNYLLEILTTIGLNAKEEKDQLFQESLFRTYTLLNRLRELIENEDLITDTITLERLIQQLVQTTNIPFHGEPAEGIQIMGVLETRNLDFDHILVLSCNEGKLPKGISDSSFIPYSIRKAYGLTTVDNKVAIYAYYFHSLLQRSTDITLTYNNSTEDGQTGEMSRFMLQLMVESSHQIQHKTLTSGQNPLKQSGNDIEKTEKILDILNQDRLLTPTFLNCYLRCPKRFYYRYIKGLKEQEEVDEDEVDNRVFGNIFHRAAQMFYLQFASSTDIRTNNKGEQQLIHPIVITKGDIENALKHDHIIYRLVDDAFREQLFKVEQKGYKPQYNGLQLINREVIANYLKQLLKIDARIAPFTILGLEIEVCKEINIEMPQGNKKIRIGGFIDRLDAIAVNGNSRAENYVERIRVIDYKTGRAPQSHPKDIGEIFQPNQLQKHTDYYLQAILYSLIVKHDRKLSPSPHVPVSPTLLFIQNAHSESYDPTLMLGKDLITDAEEYKTTFTEGLHNLICEIYNPAEPFRMTEDNKRCATCPYLALCK